MAKPYRFAYIAEGGATVLDRASGEVVGTVEYREKSWNLRRYLVARWWDADTPRPNSRKIAEGSTRGEAAQALVDHAKRSPIVQRICEAAAILNYTDSYHRDHAEKTARRYVEEAIALGAEFKLTEEPLTADVLWAWVNTQRPMNATGATD